MQVRQIFCKIISHSHFNGREPDPPVRLKMHTGLVRFWDLQMYKDDVVMKLIITVIVEVDFGFDMHTPRNSQYLKFDNDSALQSM